MSQDGAQDASRLSVSQDVSLVLSGIDRLSGQVSGEVVALMARCDEVAQIVRSGEESESQQCFLQPCGRCAPLVATLPWSTVISLTVEKKSSPNM